MDFNKLIFRISKEIHESNLSNPLLIGVPRRGDIINKKISNELNILKVKHQITNVNYEPFRDDTKKETPKDKIPITPENRNVIIVDDVIYTGRTIRAVTEAIFFSGRPVNKYCMSYR